MILILLAKICYLMVIDFLLRYFYIYIVISNILFIYIILRNNYSYFYVFLISKKNDWGINVVIFNILFYILFIYLYIFFFSRIIVSFNFFILIFIH